MAKIGQALRHLREARGMSQLALAQRSKVAQGYISALEAGTKRRPSVDVVQRLAKALGVPVTALLE